MTIPFSKLSDEWFKDHAFVREYDALEEEFAAFAAMIKAEIEAEKRDAPEIET